MESVNPGWRKRLEQTEQQQTQIAGGENQSNTQDVVGGALGPDNGPVAVVMVGVHILFHGQSSLAMDDFAGKASAGRNIDPG